VPAAATAGGAPAAAAAVEAAATAMEAAATAMEAAAATAMEAATAAAAAVEVSRLRRDRDSRQPQRRRGKAGYKCHLEAHDELRSIKPMEERRSENLRSLRLPFVHLTLGPETGSTAPENWRISGAPNEITVMFSCFMNGCS
jgi:hypothetical protein